MIVIAHRIGQSINLTPEVEVTKRSELEKRLQTLKTVINTELASRGLAIMDLAYNPENDVYHYTVPSSYNQEDYPIIQKVVEKHCSVDPPETIR